MRQGLAVPRRLVILVLGMSLPLSGCGQASQADLDRAKAAGAVEAMSHKESLQQEEQAKLSAELTKLRLDAAMARRGALQPKSTPALRGRLAPAPPRTLCGGNVSVGPNTSCAFAANVEAAYYGEGGGTTSIAVHSPVTGRYYTMNCVAGIPSVCRDGNSAIVFIR